MRTGRFDFEIELLLMSELSALCDFCDNLNCLLYFDITRFTPPQVCRMSKSYLQAVSATGAEEGKGGVKGKVEGGASGGMS